MITVDNITHVADVDIKEVRHVFNWQIKTC